MSFVCSEVENMSISTNYYEFIKQMYSNVTKYIKKYKEDTGEYFKKLVKIQEKYKQKLNGVEELKKINNINTSHIISLSNNLFDVINVQVNNLKIFLVEVEDIIKSFEKTLKEKNTMSTGYLNEYEDCKNNLQKKYKEIEKAKISFFDNASYTENLIYNFNQPKTKTQKELDTQNITKTMIDNSIKATKKYETEYTNLVKSAKNYEDKFFELTGNSIDNMKRISCEMLTKMKDNIVNFLLNIKNCFKLPLGEIDTFLPQLVNLDENKNIEEIINSTYKKDNNLIRVQTEKYQIKLIPSSNKDMFNDEDLIYVVEEPEILKTVKEMENNFNLIVKGRIEEINSPEKMRCLYLTYKLLSFSKKCKIEFNSLVNYMENNNNNNENKININIIEEIGITDDEIQELSKLLEKNENRLLFLRKLNNFRAFGNLEFPKREFHITCNIFNQISKVIKEDKNLEAQLAIVLLSETYYKIEKEKKVYILKYIKNNKIFHEKEFWNDFINKSILKEVQRTLKNDLKNNKIENGSQKKNFGKLVFAQILPIMRTMIEFELDEKIIYELLENLVSYYKLDEESKQMLFSMLSINGTEKQNEINDKCEKILELSCIEEDENEYRETIFETVKNIKNLKLNQKKENNVKDEKKEEKEEEEKEEKGEKGEKKEKDENQKMVKSTNSDEFEEINKEMIKDDVEDDIEEEIEENKINENEVNAEKK